MKLFQFAFCFDYDKKINTLSNLCPEKWSFGSNSDNVILKNYIDHTLEKVYGENKVIENQNKNKQKWFLDGFYTSYQTFRFFICRLDRGRFNQRGSGIIFLFPLNGSRRLRAYVIAYPVHILYFL